MASMERPKCEWGGVGGCERPATWMVGFVHSGRFRLSCKDHLDDWQKNGAVYWSAELRGFFGDWDHVTTAPKMSAAKEVRLPDAQTENARAASRTDTRSGSG